MLFITVVEVTDSAKSFKTWDDYFGNGADIGDFTKWYFPLQPMNLFLARKLFLDPDRKKEVWSNSELTIKELGQVYLKKQRE